MFSSLSFLGITISNIYERYTSIYSKKNKKNIIKKQNREINNRQIYSYMHDIFGAEVIDIFDMEYQK